MNHATASDSSSTERWQSLDGAHHLHPFTNPDDLQKKPVRIIESAEGVYLTDSDGNRLLDMMAGLWCVNMGYGRRELIDAAYAQIQKLPYYNAFFKTSTPPAAELSALLSEVTPAHINHAFFTSSGSEANDTVLRLVWRYWDLMGKPEKRVVISRKNAYHGSTIASSSLGGMEEMHKQGGIIPDIVHVEQPNWFAKRCQLGKDLERDEFGRQTAQSIADKIEELGVDRVAAFIAEPIQGAGGVIVPPDSYWPEVKKICDHYGILLVADEVICGFGRTGEWFGTDYYQLKPDLMPIAKGLSSGYLPIGGVMVADRIMETLAGGGDFNHGYTYSGHPVCAAVAIANIRLMQRDNIVQTVRESTAPYLQQRLRELGDHPLVGEVRGVGMLGALELVQDKENFIKFDSKRGVGNICRDFCFDNNLVMRAVGDTMIISPPLILQQSDVDDFIDRARQCLDLTQKAIG
ncbi:MAG TPA: aspartate aminotransferase family protein [Gammaproteobacteria bacterium]|nr:aspartate aminotransferase family protein [Gammaproteobacteria bacterium]